MPWSTLHRDELGREVRGITQVPGRACLVKWAFTAYASGNYSLAKLRTELTNKGLRSGPTPKRPARPLGLSSVHRMLQNPYYKGDVVYRGVRYDGAHERLVEPELWYQVQSVLRSHAQSGVRTQKHDHYLKGTLFCGRCRQRMTIIHAKNRHGNIYPYFICLGRNNKRTTCDMPYAPAGRVEKLTADYYQRITLTPAVTDALRGMLMHEFDQLTAGTNPDDLYPHLPEQRTTRSPPTPQHPSRPSSTKPPSSRPSPGPTSTPPATRKAML